MVNNEFRNLLSKIVQFIFDNEREFISKFIKETLTENLANHHSSIKKVSGLELKNVLLSDSRVFIRIKYNYDNDEKNYLDYEEKDFFIDSNEVFDWVNEKTK